MTRKNTKTGCRAALATRIDETTPNTMNARPCTTVYENKAGTVPDCPRNAVPRSWGVRNGSPRIVSIARNQNATMAAPMIPATSPSYSTLPQGSMRTRGSVRWPTKKYQSIAIAASMLPTRIDHHTRAPIIEAPTAPSTPRKNVSKHAKRMMTAMKSAGSRSLTAMKAAATTPNAMKARPCTIV